MPLHADTIWQGKATARPIGSIIAPFWPVVYTFGRQLPILPKIGSSGNGRDFPCGCFIVFLAGVTDVTGRYFAPVTLFDRQLVVFA